MRLVKLSESAKSFKHTRKFNPSVHACSAMNKCTESHIHNTPKSQNRQQSEALLCADKRLCEKIRLNQSCQSVILTFSRVLNGAFLSSCSRFPMIGRPGGPGGKHNSLLRFFSRNSHSKTMSSPAAINVTESSIVLRDRKDSTLSSAAD